jgi:hypothetical protein
MAVGQTLEPSSVVQCAHACPPAKTSPVSRYADIWTQREKAAADLFLAKGKRMRRQMARLVALHSYPTKDWAALATPRARFILSPPPSISTAVPVGARHAHGHGGCMNRIVAHWQLVVSEQPTQLHPNLGPALLPASMPPFIVRLQLATHPPPTAPHDFTTTHHPRTPLLPICHLPGKVCTRDLPGSTCKSNSVPPCHHPGFLVR